MSQINFANFQKRYLPLLLLHWCLRLRHLSSQYHSVLVKGHQNWICYLAFPSVIQESEIRYHLPHTHRLWKPRLTISSMAGIVQECQVANLALATRLPSFLLPLVSQYLMTQLLLYNHLLLQALYWLPLGLPPFVFFWLSTLFSNWNLPPLLRPA